MTHPRFPFLYQGSHFTGNFHHNQNSMEIWFYCDFIVGYYIDENFIHNTSHLSCHVQNFVVTRLPSGWENNEISNNLNYNIRTLEQWKMLLKRAAESCISPMIYQIENQIILFVLECKRKGFREFSDTIPVFSFRPLKQYWTCHQLPEKQPCKNHEMSRVS